MDESGDISKSGLPEAMKFWVIIGTQNHLPHTSTMAIPKGPLELRRIRIVRKFRPL